MALTFTDENPYQDCRCVTSVLEKFLHDLDVCYIEYNCIVVLDKSIGGLFMIENIISRRPPL